MSESKFVGVDGCRGGWFSIGFDQGGNYVSSEVFTSFKELVSYYENAELILVDIPIGLPEGKKERLCDKEARESLNQNGSKRGSSVFRTPVRAAVEYLGGAPCYGDVTEVVQDYLKKAVKTKCHKDVALGIAQDTQIEVAKQIRHAIARGIQRQITGKSLSEQTLGIASKIAEVDALLPYSGTPQIREVHPEICFRAMNNGQPMQHSKTRNKNQAVKERLEVLKSVEAETETIFQDACEKFPRKDVERHDILDALAAAITAYRVSSIDKPSTPPENPKRDSKGLPMEMVYWQPAP